MRRQRAKPWAVVVFSANSDFEDLPLETIVSYSLSMEDRLTGESTYNSIYMKGALSLLENKLKPYVDLQFAAYGGDSENSSTRLNLGSSYYLFKNTFLSTNIGTKFFADSNDDLNDYSLFDWRFKFTQKF